jgi:protein tyrosine phosphatase
LVHCSDGIGRTGSIVSLAEMIIDISGQTNRDVPDPEFSLFHTVRRLREQRYGSVSSLEQYKFCQDFI